MDLLKSLSGKVVVAIAALAVIAGGISWWQMSPSDRQAVLGGIGKLAAWVGVVVTLPWASFFITKWVAQRDSNLAGAVLVLGYTIVESALLVWLFQESLSGATAWTSAAAATLLAGVYNLFTCDWIAEKA